MKHLLITTIAAVLLVGCGPSVDIWEAARTGNIEAVKQHLAAGVDVNAKDVDGINPLHYATWTDHKETVELLITNGADVNAKDAAGNTPLDLSISKLEIADLLRKYGGKTEKELENAEPVTEAAKPEPPTVKAPDISIHDAAFEGNIEAVKQHLAAGVDVNAKSDKLGTTPLHYAAKRGEKEIAELLIANGADVNARGMMGWTPLSWAANKEIAELLIAKGADVKAKTDFEYTPLHWAAVSGHKEVAELLIANGADVNAIIVSGQYQGKTPLDMAIRLRRTETIDLLRKHGGKTGEELKSAGK
jgi:ankyrin repeat protein